MDFKNIFFEELEKHEIKRSEYDSYSIYTWEYSEVLLSQPQKITDKQKENLMEGLKHILSKREELKKKRELS